MKMDNNTMAVGRRERQNGCGIYRYRKSTKLMHTKTITPRNLVQGVQVSMESQYLVLMLHPRSCLEVY